MKSNDVPKDPLAVDEILRQIEAAKKAWRKPSNEHPPHVRAKSWQRVLDERQVPAKRW